MSNKVQGLIWDIDFPNVHAKMVALKLADNAHDDGSNIYPASATTALMTGCARSVVLKWIFAMEHCGMLLVEKRSVGGRNNTRTRRAYDLDLLRQLAWVDRRQNKPPTMALQPTTIVRPSQKPKGDQMLFDGDSKLVTVPVFEIVPWVEPVRQTDSSPVRETDSLEAELSARRTAPVRETDGTRPPDGHVTLVSQPSGNPATENRTLLTAEAGRLLIPFGGTEVSSIIAEGAAAAKAKRDGPERLPFTSHALLQVQMLGINAEQLVQRYFDRTKGKAIKDPTAYLLKMARDEAAKKLGAPASIIQHATSKDPKVRGLAQAAAVGGGAVSLAEALASLGSHVRKVG